MPKKGYKQTTEQKEQRKQIMKGNSFAKGKHWKLSDKNKQNIGIAKRGKKRKPFSKEWKINLGKASKGKLAGEKNPMWKGGKSLELYSIYWTETLKRSIRERDGYRCQLCGKTQIEELEEIEKKLAVHHKDYNKKNCDPKNLITLCLECHNKTNFNRNYWINYFRRSITKNNFNNKL